MSAPTASYEQILLSKLKNDDQTAFTIIFTKYYADLVRFSYGFTRNSNASEEIVQEVFLKLWENRNSLEIHTSLKSFLLKSVQNRCIDSLRHAAITSKYASVILDHPILLQNETENYILYSDLETNFNLAIRKIPIQFAEVFRMSRIEMRSYVEIAAILGVSVRTVEVRISKALSLLREELRDFLFIGLILLNL